MRCRAALVVARHHFASSARIPVTDPDEPVCSAKGCTEPATVALLWNNPKIHTPERRKSWLACDEHEDHLTRFLAARSFLRDTQPI